MLKPTPVVYEFDPAEKPARDRMRAKDRAIRNAMEGAGKPARGGGVMDQLRAGRRGDLLDEARGACPF